MKLSYRNSTNAQAIARIYNKPLDKPEWFKIVNSKDKDDESEILLFDYIGWPYNDPIDLIRAMGEMGNVTIRINSPGGDVFDGIAIYNALQSHKGGVVTTRNEGLAASIASVIAMGGKKRVAYENAFTMVHLAWTVVAGNQHELRETADLLEKIDGNLIDIYQSKSKQGKKRINEMMKAETWMTAKEALDLGFVDSIIDGKSARASYDLSMYANTPDDFRGVGREPSEHEKERVLRDVGFSRMEAKAIIARCKSGELGGDLRDAEDLRKCMDNLIAKMKF